MRIAERFDAWVEITRSIGVEAGRAEAPDTPFRGTLQANISPSLSFLDYDADNCPVYRLAPQIKRIEWDQFWIYRELGSGAWINIGGRDFVTRPGDFLVADADRPFQTEAVEAYRHQLWMIPRAILTPHLPPMPQPFVVSIPVEHPVNRFLQSYLDVVAREFGQLTDPLLLPVADHIARLVAIAAGAAAGKHGSAVQSALLEQARRFITQNLGAHDLTPERIAGELGISVRQLHLCFQPTGESLGHYIRSRRLAACRAMLEDPLAVQRTVTEIAFAWGFSSMPTFYRAFQNAYGATPLEIRAAAMAKVIEKIDADGKSILR